MLRAADLVGQLGDPNYLKKANALFYEFEEIGLNKTLGYDTPAVVVYKYPDNVAPQIQTAIRYLNVASHGRLPAEVCERMRRDGGSVFPAPVKTG